MPTGIEEFAAALIAAAGEIATAGTALAPFTSMPASAGYADFEAQQSCNPAFDAELQDGSYADPGGCVCYDDRSSTHGAQPGVATTPSPVTGDKPSSAPSVAAVSPDSNVTIVTFDDPMVIEGAPWTVELPPSGGHDTNQSFAPPTNTPIGPTAGSTNAGSAGPALRPSQDFESQPFAYSTPAQSSETSLPDQQMESTHGGPPSPSYEMSPSLSPYPFPQSTLQPALRTKRADIQKKKSSESRKVTSMIPVDSEPLTGNDKQIIEGLKAIRDSLYASATSGTLTYRRQKLLLGLESFIPPLEHRLVQLRKGYGQKNKNFKIGYLALLELVNPDNAKTYAGGAPYKKVNKWGDVSFGEGVSEHCNHFVYDIVESATGTRLFQERIRSYGMIGAGEYSQNPDISSLYGIKGQGEFGDIVAFNENDAYSNHVGIYLGNNLYVSATDQGLSQFSFARGGIELNNVEYPPYFRTVR